MTNKSKARTLRVAVIETHEDGSVRLRLVGGRVVLIKRVTPAYSSAAVTWESLLPDITPDSKVHVASTREILEAEGGLAF